MDIYSALAEPRRREIIELLAAHGKLTATDISDNFKISAPAVSQHLKILREARLVDMERKAQRRIYAINPSRLTELEDWVNKLKKVWNERLDRLDKVLTEN